MKYLNCAILLYKVPKEVKKRRRRRRYFDYMVYIKNENSKEKGMIFQLKIFVASLREKIRKWYSLNDVTKVLV